MRAFALGGTKTTTTTSHKKGCTSANDAQPAAGTCSAYWRWQSVSHIICWQLRAHGEMRWTMITQIAVEACNDVTHWTLAVTASNDCVKEFGFVADNSSNWRPPLMSAANSDEILQWVNLADTLCRGRVLLINPSPGLCHKPLWVYVINHSQDLCHKPLSGSMSLTNLWVFVINPFQDLCHKLLSGSMS